MCLDKAVLAQRGGGTDTPAPQTYKTKDGRGSPEERRSGAGGSGYKDSKKEPWMNIVHAVSTLLAYPQEEM